MALNCFVSEDSIHCFLNAVDTVDDDVYNLTLHILSYIQFLGLYDLTIERNGRIYTVNRRRIKGV